jgi:chromosome segregation ATPase
MTAAAPKVTNIGSRTAPSTPLDKRRAKYLATVDAATAAEAALAGVDAELEANAARRAAGKAELEAAIARAAELEKELKALAKKRATLREDRADAKRGVKKSRVRVKLAEKKFDKALLVDMLHKAKAAALSSTDGAAPVRRSRPATPAKASGTAPRRAAAARRTTAANTTTPQG